MKNLLEIMVIIAAGMLGYMVSSLLSDNSAPPSTIAYLETPSDQIELVLLNFYVNDYCAGENPRHILFKGFGTEFDSIYCDKPTVLLLMNELPFAVVHMEDAGDK